MKKFFVILALCAFVLLIVIGIYSFGGEALVWRAAGHLILAQDRAGHITLRGEVVGEDGQPMDGVTFKVTHHKSFPSDIEHNPVTKTIDGTFKINAMGWSFIWISFEKEGYYSERFKLLSRFAPPDELRGYRPSDGSARIVLRQPDGSVRIVLQKTNK